MVDDRALEFGERCEALVEVPLGEPGGQTHPADTERAGALGSGDLEGGLTSRFRRSLRRSSALIPLKGIVTWYSMSAQPS
jgi:hypothetical protein